jgi:hypothetical protein
MRPNRAARNTRSLGDPHSFHARFLLPAIPPRSPRLLGLIFLKYVSASFAVRQREIEAQLHDPKSDYFLDPEERLLRAGGERKKAE